MLCPFHCWPHQQRPEGSMMQVPLPQQRGSSVTVGPPSAIGRRLPIRTPLERNLALAAGRAPQAPAAQV
jgi:hypothetical protein